MLSTITFIIGIVLGLLITWIGYRDHSTADFFSGIGIFIVFLSLFIINAPVSRRSVVRAYNERQRIEATVDAFCSADPATQESLIRTGSTVRLNADALRLNTLILECQRHRRVDSKAWNNSVYPAAIAALDCVPFLGTGTDGALFKRMWKDHDPLDASGTSRNDRRELTSLKTLDLSCNYIELH